MLVYIFERDEAYKFKIYVLYVAGDAFKARTLINQLSKLGCRPDETTVSSLISLYGKQQKLKQAKEVYLTFADSPATEKLLCKSMLDAYVKCGKSGDAFSLYKQVTETGNCLDAVSISIVVNSLSNSGMALWLIPNI